MKPVSAKHLPVDELCELLLFPTHDTIDAIVEDIECRMNTPIYENCTSFPSLYPIKYERPPSIFIPTATNVQYAYNYNCSPLSSVSPTPELPTSMSVDQIIARRLCVAELIRRNALIHVAKDKCGYRYLKTVVHRQHVASIIEHFCQIGANWTVLSEDIFANHVVQWLFQLGNEREQSQLCEIFLYKSCFRLIKSKAGCFVLRAALEYIHSKQLLLQLAHNFKLAFFREQEQNQFRRESETFTFRDCLRSYDANRVLQQMVGLKLPFDSVQFIAIELQQRLFTYSKHIYGCRLIQQFIAVYHDKLDVSSLFANSDKLVELCKSEFGNYVVQTIIDIHKPYAASCKEYREFVMAKAFRPTIFTDLAQDKYGSFVLEPCLRWSSKQQRSGLVQHFQKKRRELAQLQKDTFGRFVVQTLLKCDDFMTFTFKN